MEETDKQAKEIENLKKRLYRASSSQKVILKNNGDLTEVTMLTSVIRDLKLSHPDLLISVHTRYPEIWGYNPFIGEIDEDDPFVKIYNIKNDLYNSRNDGTYHAVHGLRKNIERQLNLKIKPTRFEGSIYLDDHDDSWNNKIENMGIENKYWIIHIGEKTDKETLKWATRYYQEIVDYFYKKITFVQVCLNPIGVAKLNNVVDMVEKTSLTNFIYLIRNSLGAVCINSCVPNLSSCIAYSDRKKYRPCIVVAGGSESPHWSSYPYHRFLSSTGCIDCCSDGGCLKKYCYKNKIVKDKELCLYLTNIDNEIIPRCMALISPRLAIRAIECFYSGEVFKYND